jgi:plasmid stabilization system protein ParE
VARLVYRAGALRDLAEIAAYIERRSNSRAVADAFVDKLTGYCQHIATLPAMMGRSRQELRAGYRSITFGNYVIFLMYSDEEGPRSHLHVARIFHGSRDIDAYFAEHQDDEGT